LQELDGIDGLSRRQIQHLGVKLLRAIEEGKKAPLPTQGKRARRHTSEVSNRYNRLQEWRKHAAQERGVESDVILSRDILWAIAESDPKTLDELEAVPGLGDHRRTLYGEEILRELAERQPAEEA
jgi:superfamily II DNA helicase RecQ